MKKKYYRVFRNYTDYISIDDTELEKAMRAFVAGAQVILSEGAIGKIHDIIPDYHRMMGFNAEYRLNAEDSGIISRDQTCSEAKLLLSKTKEVIAGREPPDALHSGARALADGDH